MAEHLTLGPCIALEVRYKILAIFSGFFVILSFFFNNLDKKMPSIVLDNYVDHMSKIILFFL
jgi:hypothetical protein